MARLGLTSSGPKGHTPLTGQDHISLPSRLLPPFLFSVTRSLCIPSLCRRFELTLGEAGTDIQTQAAESGSPRGGGRTAGTQGAGQEGLSPRPRDSRELGAPASREGHVLHHRGTCSHSPAMEPTEDCIHPPAPVPPKLPAEPGEPPGAVPREMAVVPGLSISITGLPPTPRMGNCQDTVYTPENK